MKASKLFVLLTILTLATAGSAIAVEVDGYRAPGTFNAEAYHMQQMDLNNWLASQQVEQAIKAPHAVTLSAQDMAELEALEGSQERKLRVGIVAPTNILVDLEDLEFGAQRVSDQGRVWTGVIQSKGASALRIHFTDVALPNGAELYLYNKKGEAFGPYTGTGYLGTGDFWSHTITGDTAILQLHGASKDVTYFQIQDVGHFADNFLYAKYQDRNNEKSFCSFNAPCVENASCGGTSSAVSTARDAIAHYTFIQRPYMYLCSGGLIADEGQSGTPYFLTANHCVSRDKVAGSVETYFFFTTNCGGDCYSPSSPHTVGASILSTSSSSDYTLMQLNGSAPSGAAFMGFSTDEVAYSEGYNLFRISHPSGAPQAYSEHSVDTKTGTCQSWPRGGWIYSADTYGATEGGSSGSPVVNSNGLVVGQLSGACGYNTGDVCDTSSNATVDGALAAYYPDVAAYLGGGGGGGCEDADGDGYEAASCGGNDCNDNNAAINPGEAEICGDLIDNNCNGDIDEDCGGGTCEPKGAPCTVGAASDCCSGRCHPKKLTCQ